jgi:hypothetical protein
VGALAYNLHRLVDLSLRPFDALVRALGAQAGGMVALAVLSILTGVVMLYVVRFTTPQAWVGIARNRMTSAVYETRLFLNAPGRLLIAQGRLLCWSVAYVATMIPAFVVVSVPLGLLYLHMDARFGQMPLPMGEPVLLEARLAPGQDLNQVRLELPAAVRSTAPPVRGEAMVVWRLQVGQPGAHELGVVNAGHTETKRLLAGPHDAEDRPSQVRAAGIAVSWSDGFEPPLASASGFTSLTILHPTSEETWWGMPWWLFWLLAATVAALALRGPLGVKI